MLDLFLSVPSFPRADEFAGVWAMEQTAFATAVDCLRRTDLTAHMQETAPALRSSLEMIPARNGKSIAIVRVVGTLMKQQSSMGGTSTVQLRRDIRQAVANEDVSAIVLAIDSPGGTVAGTDDLAVEVRAARKSKPVWAYIDDLGASAAYWIASQAEKVFANSPTALVGSIGTLMVTYDLSGAAEKEGVKTFVFQTGPLKGAGAPGSPITEEQAAYFQGLVNAAQQSFDEAVQKGRRLSASQLAAVRSGAVFSADEARERKLIDGIQSFEATINELTKAARPVARATASLPLSGKPAEAMKMDFNQWLAAKGFGSLALDASQRTALETAYNAERGAALLAQPPTNQPAARSIDTEIEADRQRFAVEERRRDAIRAVCEKHGNPMMTLANGERVSVASEAIGNGWNLDKATLTAIQYGRPNVPNVITGAQHPAATMPQVLEAAFCMTRGHRDVEKQFKPEVLEAAHKSYRNIGLSQMVMICAVANGYAHTPGERIHQGNLREVLHYAMPQRFSSGGFSTVSLPGILGNVANKEILGGYMEEDQTWREVAAIKSVNNFHTVTSYRMLDDMEYEEVGPGGEIKHGKLDQESYTRQAKTYAKMGAITRQNLINDDLQAFDDLRTRIGRGSIKKFNKVFWTAFMANAATFWTAARTNYISGATTNLGTDGVGLGLGVKAFRQMTSPSADGNKRIGGRPEILLVPPELEGNADKLYADTNLNVGTAVGEANIYARKYRPVVSVWLSDASYPGYSTTAWFLLRNPADKAVVVVSFLNGMQTPTVEEADADFNVLGIQLRGFHDFGCDQAEYLSGIKSKGAA